MLSLASLVKARRTHRELSAKDKNPPQTQSASTGGSDHAGFFGEAVFGGGFLSVFFRARNANKANKRVKRNLHTCVAGIGDVKPLESIRQ